MTYTTEEIREWLKETNGEYHPEHSEHGIAAWKERRDKAHVDVYWLKRLAVDFGARLPIAYPAMINDIADRLEALQKAKESSERARRSLSDACDSLQAENRELQKRIAELEASCEVLACAECGAGKLVDVRQSDRPNIGAQPDADGWIPHKAGDPMPCDGDQMIETILRGRSRGYHKMPGKVWDWTECGEETITHWRPAK